MEPISNGAGFDEVPESTPATDGLQPLGGQEREAPQQPEEQQPAQPSAREGRSEHYRTLQTGYARRQQAMRSELNERRQREELLTQRVEQQNEVLRQALEAVRQRNGGAPEEEEPDPLSPGYSKWLREQLATEVRTATKPLQEHVARQNAEMDRLLAEREQSTQQAEQHRAVVTQFETWENEYAQESPDLAYGCRERFETGRELLRSAFLDSGKDEGAATQMADLQLYAIAKSAEAVGENGVAAIDAYISSLVMGITERLGMPFVPVGPGGEGGGQPAGMTQQQPMTETARLQAVQRRAQPAGNAAPRVPGRAAQQPLEVRELWASGVTDMGLLRAAALRDTHGNMQQAGMLINQLA